MDAPEEFAAVTAEYQLGETVIAGVASALAIICGVHQPSPRKLLLYQKEDVLRNDCLMVALHVVLRNGAVVLDALLRQKVCGVGLLEQGITDILLIGQDLLNGAGVPFGFACAGEDPGQSE